MLTGYGSVVVMQAKNPLFNTVIDDTNKQISIKIKETPPLYWIISVIVKI
ncbi:hypothetical protein I3679_014795 [Proteus mirabilis]|uniref:Uncharacterized protein n=1 Tax=Proteus mirabilis TaxID=584 RepID=A0ABD5LXJ8_PROMI